MLKRGGLVYVNTGERHADVAVADIDTERAWGAVVYYVLDNLTAWGLVVIVLCWILLWRLLNNRLHDRLFNMDNLLGVVVLVVIATSHCVGGVAS